MTRNLLRVGETLVEPVASADWLRLAEQTAFSPRDTSEGVVFGEKMWLSNGYVAGGALVAGHVVLGGRCDVDPD